ncbi:MAG TPA: FAD-binding protein [Gammaproteobacteria bacterium]|nr:FAD-binding protein [Gammaproteobacteria bacterium]
MRERPTAQHPVVIAGAGWAGLSAAVELAAHGVPVSLLESARQPGGRARSVFAHDLRVDNGQHLLVGACQSLLSLLERIQVDPRKAFLRLPLTLRLVEPDGPGLHLRAPRWPSPLHLPVALATAHGLTPGERIRALRFGRKLSTLDIHRTDDISVLALLHSEAQPAAVIRKLWGPLCIAALNTLPEAASARIFVRVLRETFSGPRKHSDLLIPGRGLSELLPVPCVDYLHHHGTHLETGQRVTGLSVQDGRIQGVSVHGRDRAASHVILATPHVISRRLMSRHAALQGLAAQLAGLGNEPVTTLYLQFAPKTRLPIPVLGLLNGLSGWVFDRALCGQPGLMAVVISARGHHERLTEETLTAQVAAELAAQFPGWPPHRRSLLIREKRATFCSRVGVDLLRPVNRTPVDGLWLAGDYTATGLPATLESAVRSGVAAAQAVLDCLRRGDGH